jgi:hypothetical protein
MDKFDKAGFRLGDVDRKCCERYPAGRLELKCLANLTHGKNKMKPILERDWPDVDLSDVEVAKCLPAWYPFLLSKGFDYWIVVTRNSDFELLQIPHDDHIRTGKPFSVEQYKEVIRCESISA